MRTTESHQVKSNGQKSSSEVGLRSPSGACLRLRNLASMNNGLGVGIFQSQTHICNKDLFFHQQNEYFSLTYVYSLIPITSEQSIILRIRWLNSPHHSDSSTCCMLQSPREFLTLTVSSCTQYQLNQNVWGMGPRHQYFSRP